MIILIVAIFIIIFFIIDTIYLDYFKYRKFATQTVEDIEKKLKDNRKMILDLRSRFIRSFHCKKCGSTVGESDVLRLLCKEFSQISSKQPHKFLKTTCKKCGFTELYNLNSILKYDTIDPLPLDIEKYGVYFHFSDNFICPKCGSKKDYPKSVYVKRRGLSRLINFQPNELIVLTCSNCNYAELFDEEILAEHKAMEISEKNFNSMF